ncbi:MAG TPA: hypothetical protein PKK17_11810 [Sphingorhabdus lacus]|nr:hypothetical protein [Sphingorhabdus lacus]
MSRDISARPLCYIGSDGDVEWEKRILAPLLSASGYMVSFDAEDRAQAAVVLSRTNDADTAHGDDARLLLLRDTVHVKPDARSSIYRYDRIGLLSAIEAKLAGVA